jgi:hypothetical protein
VSLSHVKSHVRSFEAFPSSICVGYATHDPHSYLTLRSHKSTIHKSNSFIIEQQKIYKPYSKHRYMMKYQQILLIVSAIYTTSSFVQAVDHRHNVVFDFASTESAKTKPEKRTENHHIQNQRVLAGKGVSRHAEIICQSRVLSVFTVSDGIMFRRICSLTER